MGHILKAARPADLPVEQPTTFEFLVNMKPAQALGITFPNEIMLQVTEVLQSGAVRSDCAPACSGATSGDPDCTGCAAPRAGYTTSQPYGPSATPQGLLNPDA